MTQNTSIDVVVAVSPTAGNCFGVPHSGYAAKTQFVMYCFGFADVDLPLWYEFYLKTDGVYILSYDAN